MSNYNPKNILVTGGAGFIGCNYVRYMLETDESVNIINLDALTYAGSLDNLKDLPDKVNPPGDTLLSKLNSPDGGVREGALGYKVNDDQVNCETREYPLGEVREGALGHELRHTFVQGDICDRELIDKLLRDFEIDTVVHFAAESHVDNSISGPEVFVKTNVMGTFTLLESARQYWLQENSWDRTQCRFHHISTDEVYGTLDADDPAFTETTPYAPNSPYSASKAGSDHLVRAYYHTYGLPVTTSNCSNNYGPFQHGEKFIPTVIRHCLEQKPIPVYGDGSNIRDWLYVADHCSGIDAVIRRGSLGETYNIGGLNEWPNIEICRLICRLMDEFVPQDAPHESLITFVKDRSGHDWRYAIDATKMNDVLNWQPDETFEKGIRKTVEWCLRAA